MEQETDSKLSFNRKTIIRSVVTIVVLVVLYLLVRRLSGVLLPFLISFVVAYILAPIVSFFQHRCRLKSRILSVIVTILLVTGVLTGVVAALVPAISKQATSLSNSVKDYLNDFQGYDYFSPRVNEKIEEIIQSVDIHSLIHNAEFQNGVKELLPHQVNVLQQQMVHDKNIVPLPSLQQFLNLLKMYLRKLLLIFLIMGKISMLKIMILVDIN